MEKWPSAFGQKVGPSRSEVEIEGAKRALRRWVGASRWCINAWRVGCQALANHDDKELRDLVLRMEKLRPAMSQVGLDARQAQAKRRLLARAKADREVRDAKRAAWKRR